MCSQKNIIDYKCDSVQNSITKIKRVVLQLADKINTSTYKIKHGKTVS